MFPVDLRFLLTAIAFALGRTAAIIFHRARTTAPGFLALSHERNDARTFGPSIFAFCAHDRWERDPSEAEEGSLRKAGAIVDLVR